MTKHNRNLTLLLITIYIVFALILWKYFGATVSEVITVIIFGMIIALIAMVGLKKLGAKEAEGSRGVSRQYWAALISFAIAFIFGLLLSIVLIPFIGYKVFDLLLGKWELSWLCLVLLTALLYPVVNKRLLKSTFS